MKRMSKLFALALTGSMLLSVPASVYAESAEELPREETLYFAGQQWGTVNDYNPYSSNSNCWAMAANDSARVMMWETLFMWNPINGELYPLLAVDQPEWNEEMTELTVKLNPDAKWNDGTQVTAADVAATVQFHYDVNSGTGGDMKNYIESVEVVDDTTVKFIATKSEDGKAVNPLQVLAYMPKLYIAQKAYLEATLEKVGGDSEAFKLERMEDAVTSGPYKPYVANDQKLVFVRDDNYWGQAESLWGKLATPKYLAHTIYKDNAAGQVALEQGEVDVCQQFITDVQKLWEEEDLPISTYLDEAPYGLCLSLPSIWFNTKVEGLDVKEIRKAIAMATDFEQIIASAMSGQSPTFDQVPRSIMNPTDAEQALVDQDALKEYQWANADIEGANALLDEAGIVDTDGDGIREYNGNNLSFKAECPSGWTDWNATLEIVAQAGNNIGIAIETYFPEASTFYDDMTTRKFDICMWTGPGSSVANPYLRGMSYLSSSYNSLEVNWSGNFGSFVSERADEILTAIPFETDEAALKSYYTELSQIWLDEVPSFAAMYRPQNFHAINESVWTGFAMAGDGTDIPPMNCTDGYGIADLYNLELVEAE